MRRFGHANGYARSLITGLWPSLDVLPPAETAATGKKIRPRSLRIPVRLPAEAGAQPTCSPPVVSKTRLRHDDGEGLGVG